MRKIILTILIMTLFSATALQAEEEGAWDKTKSGAKEAWSGVKQGSKKAWQGVKQGSKEAWEASDEPREKVKQGSKGVWESIKDLFR